VLELLTLTLGRHGIRSQECQVKRANYPPM